MERRKGERRIGKKRGRRDGELSKRGVEIVRKDSREMEESDTSPDTGLSKFNRVNARSFVS